MKLNTVKLRYNRHLKALLAKRSVALRAADPNHCGDHFLYQQQTRKPNPKIQQVLDQFLIRKQKLIRRALRQCDLVFSLWHYSRPVVEKPDEQRRKPGYRVGREVRRRSRRT